MVRLVRSLAERTFQLSYERLPFDAEGQAAPLRDGDEARTKLRVEERRPRALLAVVRVLSTLLALQGEVWRLGDPLRVFDLNGIYWSGWLIRALRMKSDLPSSDEFAMFAQFRTNF